MSICATVDWRHRPSILVSWQEIAQPKTFRETNKKYFIALPMVELQHHSAGRFMSTRTCYKLQQRSDATKLHRVARVQVRFETGPPMGGGGSAPAPIRLQVLLLA